MPCRESVFGSADPASFSTLRVLPVQMEDNEFVLRTWISTWSLQTRFLALTIILSSLVLLVTNWVTMVSSIRAVEGTTGEQTGQAARRLGGMLSGASRKPLPPQFDDQVSQILELEPNISRVDVYAQIDGVLRPVDSSSSRGDRKLEEREISAFNRNKTNTFIIGSGSARQVLSVYPLQFQDGQRGFVTVLSSLEAVDQILRAHAQIRLLSLGVTTFLLVAAIIWLFRTTVYRSVHHLVDVMHRFREGQSSARASETSTDELGDLAHNLNYMLEEMEKFNVHLKSQVEGATDQLASRNRELQDLNLQLYMTQKRLTQAERLALVGQLTATFAHEVGSPLSAISTQLQMLQEDPQLNPSHRHRVEIANEQIDRVCTIVEGLLSTARRSSRRSPVELAEIVRKVAHLLGPTMESRQVNFQLQTLGGPFVIEGDPDQLQQLFLNLFNNSLDAIYGPGSISVEIRSLVSAQKGKPDMVQIEISDSGIGIPAERVSQIFEPLFTTKEFGKGTGLGLAVSREIIQQHQGQISVKSPSGGGACFTILLPEMPQATSLAQSDPLKREASSR
jgi:signal transduction histidine kinase